MRRVLSVTVDNTQSPGRKRGALLVTKYPQLSTGRRLHLFVGLILLVLLFCVGFKLATTFSVKYYFHQVLHMEAAGQQQSSRSLVPQIATELCVDYINMTILVVCTVWLLFMLDGVFYYDCGSLRTARRISQSVPAVVGLSAVLAATFDLDNYVGLKATLFQVFTQHHYGFEAVGILLAPVVNGFQQQFQCCGLRLVNESDVHYPAYYAILYWLETTNWGQTQALAVNFNHSNAVQFVPTSCCRNQADVGCNVGLFGDRLRWSANKEVNWSTRIYSRQCNDFVQYYGLYYGVGSEGYYVGTMLLLLTMSAMSVFGALLAKAIRSLRQSNAPRRRHRD